MDFLFGLLVILLPTQIALHIWPDWALVQGIRVDYLAPAIYLTDIIIVALVLNLKKIPRFFFYLLPFIALNTIYSEIWQVTLFKWIKITEFGLLAVFVNENKKQIINRLPKPLLIAVGYSLLFGMAQILNGGTLNGLFYFLGERSFNLSTPGIALVNIFGQNYIRPYATFPHPNVFAGFMLVSFFIFSLSKNRKIIEKSGMIISFIGVIISFSLGAYIALIGSFLFKKSFRFLFPAVLYFSLVLPIFSSFVLIGGVHLPKNIEERLVLSKTAGEVFSASPLIGSGLGTSLAASRLLQPPHNIFLLVFSEVGIIGICLFVYLIVKLFRKSPSIVLFAILLTGMVDHYWLTLQQSQLLFAIVIGGIL